MNKVIKYKSQYQQQVKALCDKHGIAMPYDCAVLLLTVNENDEVVGLIGTKQIVHIEPLISTNPIVAYELGKMVEGILINEEVGNVRVTVDKNNEKEIAGLSKIGFEVINIDKITMEKNYG